MGSLSAVRQLASLHFKRCCTTRSSGICEAVLTLWILASGLARCNRYRAGRFVHRCTHTKDVFKIRVGGLASEPWPFASAGPRRAPVCGPARI